MFACINLFVIFPGVFFFFVETRGRGLEEIDLIFAEAYSDPTLGGYIKHSKTRPHVSGRQLDAELATALRVGKLRHRNGGDISHIEDVDVDAGEKRGSMRRLDSEKALRPSESSSSDESRAGEAVAKGETQMREFV